MTAEFVWTTGENHFGAHFYIVEAWRFNPKLDRYEKAVSYQTRIKYKVLDQGSSIHVLGQERENILGGLQRHEYPAKQADFNSERGFSTAARLLNCNLVVSIRKSRQAG